jgi:type II secretory pathway pseudopilin PulG
MSMEAGFTGIRTGISIFIILTILAFAAPRIWEEIGIAGGGNDAYFGVWG